MDRDVLQIKELNVLRTVKVLSDFAYRKPVFRVIEGELNCEPLAILIYNDALTTQTHDCSYDITYNTVSYVISP